MPVGSVPETFEDTMEIRWKEEGKSTTATFSAVINGKEVRFIGHKEYDAAKGQFIWRSKGEGLPETSSRETYDPKKKTYHGKSSFPDGILDFGKRAIRRRPPKIEYSSKEIKVQWRIS